MAITSESSNRGTFGIAETKARRLVLVIIRDRDAGENNKSISFTDVRGLLAGAAFD